MEVVEKLVVTLLPDGEIVMVGSDFTLQGFLLGGKQPEGSSVLDASEAAAGL